MSIRQRRLLIGGGIAAAVIVLLLLLFLFRGWVREPLMPVYGSLLYKPGVGKHFDQDFPPVNAKLSKLGFTFADDTYRQYRCHQIGCHKAQVSDERSFTEDFVDTWRQQAPAFESYLLESGWHKEWDRNQPIGTIFDNPYKDTSTSVHYSKRHGKIWCELSLVYFASFPNTEKARVHEACSRTVTFP